MRNWMSLQKRREAPLRSGADWAWHGKVNRRNLGISLHTLPPRLAGNELAEPSMCFLRGSKGTRHRHLLIITSSKHVVFYFSQSSVWRSYSWRPWLRGGKKRTEGAKWRGGRGEKAERPSCGDLDDDERRDTADLSSEGERVLLIQLTPRPSLLSACLFFISLHPSLQRHSHFFSGKLYLVCSYNIIKSFFKQYMIIWWMLQVINFTD